jgi:hypothetical protein
MTISAFPNGHNPKTGMTDSGMTLRDYFAAKAMQVLMQAMFREPGLIETPDEYAATAYKIADAMMKARDD